MTPGLRVHARACMTLDPHPRSNTRRSPSTCNPVTRRRMRPSAADLCHCRAAEYACICRFRVRVSTWWCARQARRRRQVLGGGCRRAAIPTMQQRATRKRTMSHCIHICIRGIGSSWTFNCQMVGIQYLRYPVSLQQAGSRRHATRPQTLMRSVRQRAPKVASISKQVATPCNKQTPGIRRMCHAGLQCTPNTPTDTKFRRTNAVPTWCVPRSALALSTLSYRLHPAVADCHAVRARAAAAYA